MKRALWIFAGIALLALLATSATARADSITLTPIAPTSWTANASSGQTLVFSGTIAAPNSNAADVYLNSDLFVSLSAPLTGDLDSYLVYFPLSLAPGDTYTGDLFAIEVPAGTAAGVYLGRFEILGGGDEYSYDSLAGSDFNIKVGDSAPAVPEPASLFLIAGGAAALLLLPKVSRR